MIRDEIIGQYVRQHAEAKAELTRLESEASLHIQKLQSVMALIHQMRGQSSAGLAKIFEIEEGKLVATIQKAIASYPSKESLTVFFEEVRTFAQRAEDAQVELKRQGVTL